MGILLIAACAILLTAGHSTYANSVAVWAYYFLVIGVLGLLIEYVREGRKEQRLKTAESIIEKDVDQVLSQLREDVFKGKRILVTGGAGFLGSWLCEILVRMGAKVVCLDNLSTGRIENITKLLKNKNFTFIKTDINEWQPEEKFDYIIHGASLPSPEDYMEKPLETMLPNSLGLLNLLENAKKNDAQILYLSTSEIYHGR